MSEDLKSKSITVQRSVMKVTKEPFTFLSKADPPVKCCRCFPNSITSTGVCGCCQFEHATGVQGERVYDPDPFDEAKPADPEADPEE